MRSVVIFITCDLLLHAVCRACVTASGPKVFVYREVDEIVNDLCNFY